MSKKKICWISPDCFLDTDFNPFNINEVLKYYDIHWIVLFSRNNRFKESDFEQIKKENTTYGYKMNNNRFVWNEKFLKKVKEYCSNNKEKFEALYED